MIGNAWIVFYFAEIELQQLQREARQSLRNAYAIGTFDNLSIQRVKYLKFCVYFDITPFPASTVVLVWYAQYLTWTLKAHSSIVGYLSRIKTLHTLFKLQDRRVSRVLVEAHIARN